jgi:hypothetical protein
MPLNLEPRSSDFTPYLKFNGKAGRWYTRNDVGEEVEITDLIAIFDLALIKTGWIHFEEGLPPQTAWDSNAAASPKPSNMPKAKRGFAVNVFAPKIGGLREFSSTSNGAVIAVRDLYDGQFEKAPERLSKVPVVKCEKILPVKSKFGTNYEPVLKIVKWVDRPEGLPQGSPHITEPKPTKGGAAAKPDVDLDDDIPFITCDPAYEPHLIGRFRT